jgi:uncharacterized protein DUF3105
VSKESRNAARLARESRRAGNVARPSGEGRVGESGSSPAGAARPASAPAVGRPTTGGGSTAARAGRRERARIGPEPTFLEKYRSTLIAVVGVAVVAIALGFVFIGATAPAYTCTNQFNPSPTPAVSPGSSTRLGFVEDDMGNSHVVTPPQSYLYCPPASGNHYNVAGLGPIAPRVYKPDDKVGPSNWVHNLEHGAMVVLYRNDSPGASAAGQQAFKDFASTLPPSPICKIPTGVLSPVIARFDDMPHAYAALVWDRVFYLDTWDPALVTRFYLEESERLDADGALVAPPEKQCNPQASGSPNPSAAAPDTSSSPAASVEPSTGPSSSPAPSPSAS